MREGSRLFACLGPHTFVYSPTAMKRELASKPYREEEIIPPVTGSVGHIYLHPTGPDWNACHRLGYHVSFNPRDLQLEDAVAFAYGGYLTARVTTEADWKTAKVVETHD